MLWTRKFEYVIDVKETINSNIAKLKAKEICYNWYLKDDSWKAWKR